MSFLITDLSAIEILDSRGRPTLEVSLTLSDGTTASAGVPSGASTGTREAVELRDGDPARFSGAGVRTACNNVRDVQSRPAMEQPSAVVDEGDAVQERGRLSVARYLVTVMLGRVRKQLPKPIDRLEVVGIESDRLLVQQRQQAPSEPDPRTISRSAHDDAVMLRQAGGQQLAGF